MLNPGVRDVGSERTQWDPVQFNAMSCDVSRLVTKRGLPINLNFSLHVLQENVYVGLF